MMGSWVARQAKAEFGATLIHLLFSLSVERPASGSKSAPPATKRAQPGPGGCQEHGIPRTGAADGPIPARETRP